MTRRETVHRTLMPEPDGPMMTQYETQAALQINNLTVNLGSRAIVKDISVDLSAGAIGLLGPNGAGKSTLLKTIMGFLKPAAGSLKVFDLDPLREGADVRQLLGYMPEDDTYIPGMTAVEFVSYIGRLCGLPNNESILRAHQVLHYCGLGEARYRKIDTYSTGMRQRIKLAQALVHDPTLMLLDEPTNGLDPDGRKAMLDLIQDISQTKGISVILSSHLLPDVESVCDQVMVLFQGRLATAGRIGDLKRMTQRSYEVRIKGDEARFHQVLQQHQTSWEPRRDGLMRVVLDEGRGPETLFALADEAGVQVRHLALEERTLQEIFSQSIQQPADPSEN